ncbi:DUF1751-domain-containing protein [Gonapodya prolifera JEL478]|uniref:DUF1751-domain-containing protein n=1 Tax=Gonapodya prolifera (strain JEL478) TaxID=1344416 RepID=A0A139AL87_GONPJ|nr:DUF1751-domain-containing protein [Gonapodya prolifera JEL478]|eukprot:KXS17552.1 DUF1751-domain-containing protein [Gonapodya prolifera JEL478]
MSTSLLRGGPVSRTLVVVVSSLTILNHLSFRYQTTVGDNDSKPLINPMLGLVPGYWMYPWVFVTAGLFETRLVSFIGNILFVWFGGRYLENLYGTKELAIFVLLVNAVAYFLTMIAYIVLYATTGKSQLLYETQANGLLSISSAFLVAFKNVVPEHRVSFFQDLLSIKVKYLPSIFVVLFLSLMSVGVVHAEGFLVLFGTAISWIYIRFFKRQDGIRGDRSETFSFASFFPELAHPIVKPVSNMVFEILKNFGLCSVASSEIGSAPDNELPRRKPPPGSEEADAERRRALALKALELRLQNHQTPPQIPTVSVELKTVNVEP